ncbi:siderophore-interacting protein [Tessaracoccus palaemonis]|uniref:Siderophore-interacting protein n=1 Tax=Tessaracoccus palaemonis TaxID=2829499 RepID=A0ABX8SH31_9ACTN|nr:siderophore-interacting protein [Tessaracoccus palaemonis]QXT62686.1 siderophore-interacting protein [Tessaracoccus palaemonis]
MAGSTNVTVDHADNGLLVCDVVGASQLSPNFVRLTFGGDALRQWRHVGYDQWFRLAVPTSEGTRFDNLSGRYGMGGYLRYLTTPKATRPEIRNYTVRNWRPEQAELDVDFLTHGDEGVAGSWAAGLPVGDTVGLIDQGHGFRPERGTDDVLLVGDATAMPAILGILRDLPESARGTAIIEVQDEDDHQEAERPAGVGLRWIEGRPGNRPGMAALRALQDLTPPSHRVNAFVAGESQLATGGRRHLVGEWGIPKDRVTFCGYWRCPTSH